MESKYSLNLPAQVYFSVITLLILPAIAWWKVVSMNDKILSICLLALFIASFIQAAILIKKDKFDLYKNILNAVWNIETAVVFVYGIYVIIEFSYLPAEKQPSFINWALSNVKLFVLTITLLAGVCVARAGYSLAEVFKAPIQAMRKAEQTLEDKNTPPTTPNNSDNQINDAHGKQEEDIIK